MIAFAGAKNSGKDTCADYMVEKYHYKKYAFASPLKEVLKILFMFTDDQLYGDEKEKIDPIWSISPRQAMQFVGTELIRNQINPDYFIKYFELWMSKQNQPIVISDLRFVNESTFVKRHDGVIIRVDRNENQDLHSSEQEYCYIKYDYIIKNDGTLKDLYQKLDEIMLKINQV